MAEPNPNQVTKTFSITGSMFRPGASDLIKRLRPRQPLTLVREPRNQYDANAVLVTWGNRMLGYLPRGLAREIAPLLDANVKVIAQKANNPLYGVCQLAYIRPDDAEQQAAAEAEADGLPSAEHDSPPTEGSPQ